MAIFASESDGYVWQAPSARLDYAEDWSEYIARTCPGDVIETSQWSCTPDGLVFEQDVITESESLTSVFISGGVAGTAYRVQNSIETVGGRQDSRHFHLLVREAAEATPILATALFDRFTSVEEFKTSSLSFLDDSFPVDNLTDSVIWENMVAAEHEAERELRTFFAPTHVIPDSAKKAEIDALIAAGEPFAIEDDYDFDPTHWDSVAWGYLVLRQSPVITIDSVKISYPSPTQTILTVPQEWLQLDYKYGHLRFVPAGVMMGLGPMTSFLMSTMASGRTLPGSLQIRYTAGIADVKTEYPDLINLVKRMALLRILKNALLPQSGSISSDGLSQSVGIDVSKWQDDVDKDLNRYLDQIKGVRVGLL